MNNKCEWEGMPIKPYFLFQIKKCFGVSFYDCSKRRKKSPRNDHLGERVMIMVVVMVVVMVGFNDYCRYID